MAAQWFENNTTNVDTSAEIANQSLHEIPIGVSNSEDAQIANVTSSGLTSQASDKNQASIPNNQAFANGVELNFAMEIVLPAITAGIISAFVIGLFRKKNSRALYQLKPRFLKTCVILLGFLLLLVVFLPLVATANATSRAGNVWGSRSSGASNDPYSYSCRKTDDEIFQQANTSSYIASNCFTAANGYTGFNNEAANKDVILYQADYFSNNYDYVAIVDFDHGVGGYPGRAPGYDIDEDELHSMFEDDLAPYGELPLNTLPIRLTVATFIPTGVTEFMT